MRTLDFAPLWRSTIGFDHLADLVDSTLRQATEDNYPPYRTRSPSRAGSPMELRGNISTRESPHGHSGACSISPTTCR
jgi:hypothetical protein